MACYVITYDLPAGSDYEPLISAIKSYGTWAHLTKSTWAVVTAAGAPDVHAHLDAYIPASGRILVIKSGREAAWRNVMCRDQWLRGRL